MGDAPDAFPGTLSDPWNPLLGWNRPKGSPLRERLGIQCASKGCKNGPRSRASPKRKLPYDLVPSGQQIRERTADELETDLYVCDHCYRRVVAWRQSVSDLNQLALRQAPSNDDRVARVNLARSLNDVADGARVEEGAAVDRPIQDAVAESRRLATDRPPVHHEFDSRAVACEGLLILAPQQCDGEMNLTYLCNGCGSTVSAAWSKTSTPGPSRSRPPSRAPSQVATPPAAPGSGAPSPSPGSLSSPTSAGASSASSSPSPSSSQASSPGSDASSSSDRSNTRTREGRETNLRLTTALVLEGTTLAAVRAALAAVHLNPPAMRTLERSSRRIWEAATTAGKVSMGDAFRAWKARGGGPIAMDGAWSHRRNGKMFWFVVVDLLTNKIIYMVTVFQELRCNDKSTSQSPAPAAAPAPAGATTNDVDVDMTGTAANDPPAADRDVDDADGELEVNQLSHVVIDSDDDDEDELEGQLDEDELDEEAEMELAFGGPSSGAGRGAGSQPQPPSAQSAAGPVEDDSELEDTQLQTEMSLAVGLDELHQLLMQEAGLTSRAAAAGAAAAAAGDADAGAGATTGDAVPDRSSTTIPTAYKVLVMGNTTLPSKSMEGAAITAALDFFEQNGVLSAKYIPFIVADEDGGLGKQIRVRFAAKADTKQIKVLADPSHYIKNRAKQLEALLAAAVGNKTFLGAWSPILQKLKAWVSVAVQTCGRQMRSVLEATLGPAGGGGGGGGDVDDPMAGGAVMDDRATSEAAARVVVDFDRRLRAGVRHYFGQSCEPDCPCGGKRATQGYGTIVGIDVQPGAKEEARDPPSTSKVVSEEVFRRMQAAFEKLVMEMVTPGCTNFALKAIHGFSSNICESVHSLRCNLTPKNRVFHSSWTGRCWATLLIWNVGPKASRLATMSILKIKPTVQQIELLDELEKNWLKRKKDWVEKGRSMRSTSRRTLAKQMTGSTNTPVSSSQPATSGKRTRVAQYRPNGGNAIATELEDPEPGAKKARGPAAADPDRQRAPRATQAVLLECRTTGTLYKGRRVNQCGAPHCGKLYVSSHKCKE